MFGIIAGVLVGVWAMYTMLGDKTDAQSAIAEIQMLKKAAHEYKYALGKENKYTDVTMAALKPYLGQSGVAVGQNIFGATIGVRPENSARDLTVIYDGFRDIDICRQVLNQFGQVTDIVPDQDMDMLASCYIEDGKTISGFVGGENPGVTGCSTLHGETYILNITID